MFVAIYQAYLKQGTEAEYQRLWQTVAKYFIEKRGALGSCLHKRPEGLWVAYSRWPDKATRDASWPGENAPSDELPREVRDAILGIKACLDIKRQIPDLELQVVMEMKKS